MCLQYGTYTFYKLGWDGSVKSLVEILSSNRKSRNHTRLAMHSVTVSRIQDKIVNYQGMTHPTVVGTEATN